MNDLKIFNFIVLFILIKINKCEIKEKGELKILYSYYCNYKNHHFSYYLNDKFFGKIIFRKIVWEDSISYEVLKDECKLDISKLEAKLLYKMAQKKSKIKKIKNMTTKEEIIKTLDEIIANYYNYEKNLFSPLQLKELAEACKKIIEKEI